MAEEKKLNRGWVKNAAIIFLSIMVVLTFFSNTIMNRSLPEVAVQYVQSGTITAKIRGTGAVVANSTYDVCISQTRTVETVAVKVGDTVNMGDLLFTLADSESEELKAAKETLSSLKLQYSIDLINANAAYADDNRAIQKAQEDLAVAISARDRYNAASPEDIAAVKAEIADLKDDIDAWKIKEAATGFTHIDAAALKAQERAIEDKELAIAAAQVAGENTTVLEIELIRLEEDYDDMKEAARYRDKITAAEKTLAAAETDLSDLKTAYDDWKAADDQVAAAQETLDDLVYQLEQKKTVDGSINNLNLAASRAKIAEQQQLVHELSAEAVGAKVIAPMAGTITSINVAAGGTIMADQPMAVIEAPDLGYSLSFSVAAAQAKKLTLGETAEIGNYYWGADIQATLVSIKTDPENPGINKLLTFALSGEVESGSQLSITVGQRSTNYELIVPNSAIRTDSGGDFVLIVEAKNTPIGNRYIARRVDIQVLDKDDTNTAVNGGLAGWDYVITTSSKPIEPGMQVRLVEQ